MKAREILASLSGVSIPIFGIQWQPAKSEVTVARHLIRELEDRRALYRDYEAEGAAYCLRSVEDIRGYLTAAVKHASEGTELYKRLQKMRGACRAFCDAIQSPAFDSSPQTVQRSLLHRQLFKLRSVFGLCVGELSVGYGLDVDDELASIIPFNVRP